MVFGDGPFYRGFGGYWVLWFMGIMYICMSLSIWNGFGISGVMELEWINETKGSTVRFCYQNVDFAKFWKILDNPKIIMISNPKP